MRVLELFGGYGSQALALENLGIDFKSDLCDIDKYAEKAYNQLHGETFNYGDICSIDETKLPYYDLITYSSPCQDFSVAGKQAGGEKGSGTRSSLLWECERIIRAVKPKYLLMENVKALTSKKFMPLFANWLRTLENMGYKNWWKVLNAKDYGVPQNRERVFVVSILGGGSYQFPEPIKLEKRLKDVLEKNVDEKYYINKTIEALNTDSDGCARAICSNYYKQTPANVMGCGFGCSGVKEALALDEQNNYVRQDGCVGTLTTDGSSPKHNNRVIEPKVMQEPMNLYPNSGNPQAGRVYNTQGISPAMDTCQGGNRMPKITEMYNPYNKREIKDVAPTQLTNCGITTSSSTVLIKYQNYRIRKLTPRECWRLMGVRDEQFDKLHDISNSQLYKMAGNSIVVDVLMGIFKNLFMPTEQKGQIELF